MATTIFILAGFGILALIAELVLPGGILGVAGFLCLAAAAAISFVEYGFLVGLLVSIGIAGVSVSLFWLWMKYFHLLPGTRGLIMKAEVAAGDSAPESAVLSGQFGQALTEISPSGRACFGDERFDVIAESTAIAKGSTVEFIRRSGPSWVVRPAETAES